MRVKSRRKLDVLQRILAVDPHDATLVFTRTRKGCAEVAEGLVAAGIPADAIHGDLNQHARERVLNRLRSGALSVLVATDVAARGLDVNHLTRVINYDYPSDSETYVHRIGRTGRAGKQGVAVTLVTPAEQRKLRYLERAIKYDLEEKQPPTRKQITDIQKEGLWNELQGAGSGADLEELKAWLEGARADSGLDAVEIATAAVKLLCRQRGIDLCSPEEASQSRDRAPSQSRDRAPSQSRDRGASPYSDPGSSKRAPRKEHGSRPEGAERSDRAPRQHDRRDSNDAVQLFMSIGREAGVQPSDIVGALANEVGISGRDIGRISLFANKAFVGLPADLIDKAIADFPTLTIRGRNVHLSRAWPKSNEGGARPTFKKSHFRKKSKGKGKTKGGKGYLHRKTGRK